MPTPTSPSSGKPKPSTPNSTRLKARIETFVPRQMYLFHKVLSSCRALAGSVLAWPVSMREENSTRATIRRRKDSAPRHGVSGASQNSGGTRFDRYTCRTKIAANPIASTKPPKLIDTLSNTRQGRTSPADAARRDSVGFLKPVRTIRGPVLNISTHVSRYFPRNSMLINKTAKISRHTLPWFRFAPLSLFVNRTPADGVKEGGLSRS
jgi:hypothetical protein